MTSIQHSAFSPKMGTADQALNLPSSKPTFKPPAMVWWRFGRWRGFVSWVQENRAKSRVWLGLPGPYWRNGMRLEGSGEGVHTGVWFLCYWNCEHLDLKGKKNGRKKKFQRGISVDGKRVILVLHWNTSMPIVLSAFPRIWFLAPYRMPVAHGHVLLKYKVSVSHLFLAQWCSHQAVALSGVSLVLSAPALLTSLC